MAPCDVVIIRHGESEANREKILQGRYETHLTADGLAQAECAGKRLSGEKFDALYSSTLIRTRETAEIIGQYTKLVPVFDEALCEWDFGIYQGRHYDEIRRLCPAFNDIYREDAEIDLPGGETKKAFYQRAAGVFDRIASANAGKKIIIVTHGGVLHAFFCHALGPSCGMSPCVSNASYHRFTFQDGLWRLITWNDVSHLKQLSHEIMEL